MTSYEREMAIKATSQMQLGNLTFGPGISPHELTDREFKARFCKENGITEAQLTSWVTQLLDGG